MSTFFEDLKVYVGFTARDSARLLALHRVAAPHFARVSEHFYERIGEHPGAMASITGGNSQVARLKQTLVEWMDTGLRGPHDEAFYERRARIGRMHVRIKLPQQYMLTAMNVIRIDFHRIAEEHLAVDPVAERNTIRETTEALDRLFDLELAIMLQTYREDSETALRRSEQLATIGQLAATIGHDLRNPLGVIQSSLYILRKRLTDADERTERHLDKIESQVQNCNQIITDLLDLVRNRPPRIEPVAVERLFEEVLAQESVPAHIRPAFAGAGDVVVFADLGLLRQVLVNLVSNAVTAMGARAGALTLTLETPEPNIVSLTLDDDGPGFDEAVLYRAFEPLVTTRSRGTGLGLALVRSVMERHGGTADASNRSGGGARIVLRLPMRPAVTTRTESDEGASERDDPR